MATPGPRPLALALLALVLGGCLAPAHDPHETAGRGFPDSCLDHKAWMHVMDCVEPYYREQARNEGIRMAMDWTWSSMLNGSIDDCHMLAHHLGMIAFEELGNALDTVRSGDHRCLRGYVHGVIEAAVRDLEVGRYQDPVDGPTFCEDFRNEPFDGYGGCVHGLAHGIMVRTGHDVNASLPECDQFPTEGLHALCMDGVFMEVSLAWWDREPAAFDALVLSSCPSLSDLSAAARANCYVRSGQGAFMFHHHDLAAAESVCARVELPADQDSCRVGIRDEINNLRMSREGH